MIGFRFFVSSSLQEIEVVVGSGNGSAPRLSVCVGHHFLFLSFPFFASNFEFRNPKMIEIGMKGWNESMDESMDESGKK